eukprot:SAG11_NODE_262_length_11529_cov_12.277603_4_plen_87_part_00
MCVLVTTQGRVAQTVRAYGLDHKVSGSTPGTAMGGNQGSLSDFSAAILLFLDLLFLIFRFKTFTPSRFFIIGCFSFSVFSVFSCAR